MWLILAALAGGLALAATLLLEGWVAAVAYSVALLLGAAVWIFGTEGLGPAP